MAGSTHRGTWKNFERSVAVKDFDSKRNPLSGANNTDDDGNGRPGDVIMPKGVNAIVECKYRASFLHHTLFDDALADAKKHGRVNALLYTKRKRDHGWLVVLDGELFSKIIRLPGVQELLSE